MKLTEKGQVTVPKRLREKYGLSEGTEVEFEATEGGVLLRAATRPRAERLVMAITAVRGSADAGLSTDDVMGITRD